MDLETPTQAVGQAAKSWADVDDWSEELELGHTAEEMAHVPLFLDSRWTFWFDIYPGSGLSPDVYIASMKKVGSVATVQDFWRYFNNLPSVEFLNPRTSYHLMKYESRPIWEEEANINGGSLALKLRKDDSPTCWMYLLLAVIGQQFTAVLDEEDDIIGLSINIRTNEDVLILWNRNATLLNKERVVKFINSFLQGIEIMDISYKVHKQEIAKCSESPAKRLPPLKSSPIKQSSHMQSYPTLERTSKESTFHKPRSPPRYTTDYSKGIKSNNGYHSNPRRRDYNHSSLPCG